jgi:hypothetical protein
MLVFDAPCIDKNEDQYDQQQNDYDTAVTHAAWLENIDVHCQLMNLFIRQAVYFYFREGFSGERP